MEPEKLGNILFHSPARFIHSIARGMQRTCGQACPRERDWREFQILYLFFTAGVSQARCWCDISIAGL
jgi:hypothetical protein